MTGNQFYAVSSQPLPPSFSLGLPPSPSAQAWLTADLCCHRYTHSTFYSPPQTWGKMAWLLVRMKRWKQTGALFPSFPEAKISEHSKGQALGCEGGDEAGKLSVCAAHPHHIVDKTWLKLAQKSLCSPGWPETQNPTSAFRVSRWFFCFFLNFELT